MTRFRIDPKRSRVEIEGRTNLHPISAAADGLRGTIDATVIDGRLAVDQQPSASLELEVDRIRSGNALFERELQRRAEARRFPTVTGDLRVIKGELDGRYTLEGDLTFHGVTRSVQGDVTVAIPDERSIRVDGAQVFDIRDFGLEAPKLLLLKADPEVTVRLHVEASRDDEG
jgi:polyisoprenoid-binding protein YceI